MRRNKFGVSPKEQRTWNGKVYDSKGEMKYRHFLEVLKKSADPDMLVLEIEEQVKYPITINNQLICSYILDFKVTYSDRIEYVDFKGVKTPIYKLKKKMMKALYNIDIKEVTSKQF